MRNPRTIAIALALFATTAWAQHAGHHQSVKASGPTVLKWSAVPSLPKGAEIAVIEGPMNEAAPFTVRLRFPANYASPAHTHPAVERGDRALRHLPHGHGRQVRTPPARPVRPAT